jgi:opacity protein-like surface antigen
LFEEVSGETMKKFVVGFAVATALLSIADAASAADMVVKARPAAKHDPCGVARFSGFYVGGNAGAIAYTALRADSDAFIGSALDVGSPAEYSANRIGVTAGVQAGYDWQSCNKVFGLVADWNWADPQQDGLVQHNPRARRRRGERHVVLCHGRRRRSQNQIDRHQQRFHPRRYRHQ